MWTLIGAIICIAAVGIWWFSASGTPSAPNADSMPAAAALPATTTEATTTAAATTTETTAATTTEETAIVNDQESTKPAPSAIPPAHVKKQALPQDVVAVVENLGGASRFAQLLDSTGVGGALYGRGPYTLFVPTDGAFSLMSSKTISGMTSAQKKRLIEYHVIVGKEIDPGALRSGTITALSKDPSESSLCKTTKLPA